MKYFLMTTVLLMSFNLSFATKESNSPVTQIIFSPKPHIVPMEIKNLPTITSIFTAGQYAYAIDQDDAMVAFWDGKSWSEGQKINGMTSVELYSSSTLNEKPNVWALDRLRTLVPQISHFNGVTWSKPQSVYEILNIKAPNIIAAVNLKTSANYTFLLADVFSSYDGNTNVIYAVYDVKTDTWTKPNSLPGQFDSYGLQNHVDIDNLGNLYVLVRDIAFSYTLYNINSAGVAIPNNIEKLNSSYSHAILLIDNNFHYINYFEGNTVNFPQYIAFSNRQIPNNWEYVLDNSLATDVDLYPEEENSGLICKKLSDAYNNLLFDCINTNDSNPNWLPYISVIRNPDKLEQSTRENGAWLGYNLESSPHILDYDLKKNQFTETHFQPLDTNANFRSITSNKIIACSWNPNVKQKPHLYYYDHDNAIGGWYSVNNKSMNVYKCGFSSSGNLDHSTNRVDVANGETLWLFNSPFLKRNSTKSQR